MGKILNSINGKKLPIALISFVLVTAVGYGELKNSVKHNSVETDKVAPLAAQVARIEERVKSVDESFDDFRTEQRSVNNRVDDKLDRVLEALVK